MPYPPQAALPRRAVRPDPKFRNNKCDMSRGAPMIQTDAQRKKSQRERTAKHRAKVKEESAYDLAANEQRHRGEFDLWRVRSRLVTPGEREPFIDAATCPDALTIAREFLVAMSQPDIQPG